MPSPDDPREEGQPSSSPERCRRSSALTGFGRSWAGHDGGGHGDLLSRARGHDGGRHRDRLARLSVDGLVLRGPDGTDILRRGARLGAEHGTAQGKR